MQLAEPLRLVHYLCLRGDRSVLATLRRRRRIAVAAVETMILGVVDGLLSSIWGWLAAPHQTPTYISLRSSQLVISSLVCTTMLLVRRNTILTESSCTSTAQATEILCSDVMTTILRRRIHTFSLSAETRPNHRCLSVEPSVELKTSQHRASLLRSLVEVVNH